MSKDTESLAPPASDSTMIMLQPATLVRSRTNPRTRFDPVYLQELAESIRLHGVVQPILARPLPANRVQDTYEDRQHGEPLPTHEIVCGECRWRASKIAGVEQLPVLVRDLDDLQVLQVQLVENLRRQDLHPLEEAEGFSRLQEEHGMLAEDIAARVGRSESYVYKSIKLLELTPECKEQLYAGKLSQSTALLVARQPAYLQARIARDIMRADYPEGSMEPMSYREASRHIHQHFMLRLAQAPFDLADAALMPDAGDCKACPKRTGANAALFEDIESADTCTDPKCFDQKKVAHFERVAQAAKARGQKVIMGKEAQELLPHEHSTPKGYMRLDDKQYFEGEGRKSLRSVIGKAAKDKDAPKPVLILNPHSHQLEEVLPADVAGKLLKKAQAGAKAKGKDKKASARDLELQFDLACEAAVIERVHAALMAGKLTEMSVDIARVLCRRLADVCMYNGGRESERFCRLFQIEDSAVAATDAIKYWLKTCPPDQVAPAMLVLLLEDEISGGDGMRSEDGTAVQLVTSACDIDIEQIRDEVKESMRAALPHPDTPTPAAKKPAGKTAGKKAKKTTPAEAQAGIAQAMQQQGEEGDALPEMVKTTDAAAVGRAVIVRQTARPAKIRFKDGVLTQHVSGDDWMVKIAGAEHRLSVKHFDVSAPAETADMLLNGVSKTASWPFPIGRSGAK